MRSRSSIAVVTLGIFIALGSGAAAAGSTTRHDGTVEKVDAAARTLVIREYGANARVHDFRVHVAPTARVVLSERNPEATGVEHEFTSRPIRFAEIKPGDFVVVDVAGRGARAVGESVMVTLRGGE
jgi:hypothetical protein